MAWHQSERFRQIFRNNDGLDVLNYPGKARAGSFFFTVTSIEKLREAAKTLNYQDRLDSILEKMLFDGAQDRQGYVFVYGKSQSKTVQSEEVPAVEVEGQ